METGIVKGDREGNNMFYFIEFLRAIAAVLVANSHFKGVYPNDILSFGGGMGVALFFMISGYLLANINRETKFLRWYPKKLLRLLISFWLYQIVCIIFNISKIESVSDFINVFFVSIKNNWFICSLIVLYIFYFFFVKYVYSYKQNGAIYAFSGVLIVLFTILYITQADIGTFTIAELRRHNFGMENPNLIMQSVWMLCMLIGLWIKKNARFIERKSILVLFSLFAMGNIVLYMFTKLFIFRDIMLWMQFLLPVSYIGFSYCMFICLMNLEDFFKMINGTVLGKVIMMVGKCTLEIMLIQHVLINQFKDIVFPINWFVIWLTIICSAYVMHIVSEFLLNKIFKRRVNCLDKKC